MLWAASIGLCVAYLLLPIAALVIAGKSGPRGRRFATGGWLSGMFLGVTLLAVYAIGLGGRVPPFQAVLTIYCGVGLVLFLRSIDAGLSYLLRRGLLRRSRGGGGVWIAGLARVALLAAFALPWVMAAAMVYRPKIVTDAPVLLPHVAVERVSMLAADGTRISGWFYRGTTATRTTALLCHGLGGDPQGFSRLIDRLLQEEISVLAIDLRAHGESGGQFCTFGWREKQDVTGAVTWLKQNYAASAEKIVGVGASLGAAAVLGAAVGDERLDGVVVLSTYSTLDEEADYVSRHQLVPPIGWLVRHFGLAVASLHAGVNLHAVRPIDDIARLWPRPVLVVHGTDDEIIPFEQGRRLYEAAPVGRVSMWVQHGTHNGILEDAAVVDRVVNFILSAEPLPIV
ncbi:MAG TPA: alpha/beta fold hydrolase [Tepidisphaeraceae bacterium]